MNIMSEIPKEENTDKSFTRKACLSDFLDDCDTLTQSKYSKSHTQNDTYIEKNQKEFGNRKRIKP